MEQNDHKQFHDLLPSPGLFNAGGWAELSPRRNTG